VKVAAEMVEPDPKVTLRAPDLMNVPLAATELADTEVVGVPVVKVSVSFSEPADVAL
jgi:hypothetical protein